MLINRVISCSILLLVAASAEQATAAKGANGDRAFTAWAIVFNVPENCATTPCDEPDIPAANGSVIFLTGQRVQSNGRAIFAGAITADSAHAQVGGPGTGIENPDAEIHIGLQTHGGLAGDPMVRYMQTTTPGGGCMPDCGLVQAAIFLPGAVDGSVIWVDDRSPVEGATATLERSASGIKVAVDTRL